MPELLWNVPSRIETARLVLRRYEAADAEQLAEVVPRNIPHLERYMEWIKFEPQTVEQRRTWIAEVDRQFDAGEDYTYGMFDRGGRLVGGTGFHVRKDPDRLAIGYWIDREHEGLGLVTETAAALTLVALEVTGAELLDVTHAPSNTRSAAIPMRLGFARQEDGIELCHDSGETVRSVRWWATPATLATEPLASTSRPAIFDAGGAPMDWPG